MAFDNREKPVFSAAFPPLADGTLLYNTADGKGYRRVDGKWMPLEEVGLAYEPVISGYIANADDKVAEIESVTTVASNEPAPKKTTRKRTASKKK